MRVMIFQFSLARSVGVAVENLRQVFEINFQFSLARSVTGSYLTLSSHPRFLSILSCEIRTYIGVALIVLRKFCLSILSCEIRYYWREYCNVSIRVPFNSLLRGQKFLLPLIIGVSIFAFNSLLRDQLRGVKYSRVVNIKPFNSLLRDQFL